MTWLMNQAKKEVTMASNPKIQSTIVAHPQSGYNNWINYIHSQFHPKLVMRRPTSGEVIATNEHMIVYLSLLGNEDLKAIIADPSPIYINLGLNSIKFRPVIRKYPFGTYEITFKGSIVRINGTGNESQLTEEFTMRTKSVWY